MMHKGRDEICVHGGREQDRDYRKTTCPHKHLVTPATCDLWALIYIYHYAEEWIAYLNMSMPSAAIRIHAC